MIQRCILASSGALFLGSAAAFLLLVSPLSIVTVVLILVGLMLMFGLGFHLKGVELNHVPRPPLDHPQSP